MGISSDAAQKSHPNQGKSPLHETSTTKQPEGLFVSPHHSGSCPDCGDPSATEQETGIEFSESPASMSSIYVETDTPPCSPSELRPPSPLLWTWKCHVCHNRYPLGATNRCLFDGHYYCSSADSAQATTNVSTNERAWLVSRQRKRKAQKHKGICDSEFDYEAWKLWGRWRRMLLARRKGHGWIDYDNSVDERFDTIVHGLAGCETCDWPSQCRYVRAATKLQIL